MGSTDRSIEDWNGYIKGKNDATELIGANSKLLTNFQVYVNRRAIEWRGMGNSIFSWHVDNCYPIFEKE